MPSNLGLRCRRFCLVLISGMFPESRSSATSLDCLGEGLRRTTEHCQFRSHPTSTATVLSRRRALREMHPPFGPKGGWRLHPPFRRGGPAASVDRSADRESTLPGNSLRSFPTLPEGRMKCHALNSPALRSG